MIGLVILAVASYFLEPGHRLLPLNLTGRVNVPLSLFTDTGAMIPCAKQQFLHRLEDSIPGEKITGIRGADALLLDAHAVTQSLPPPRSLSVPWLANC